MISQKLDNLIRSMRQHNDAEQLPQGFVAVYLCGLESLVDQVRELERTAVPLSARTAKPTLSLIVNHRIGQVRDDR